jgi:DNA-binding NarL/FixJ family response regulator
LSRPSASRPFTIRKSGTLTEWPEAPTPAMIEMAELLGRDVTLKLVNAFGGTRLFVAQSADAPSMAKVTELIGMEATRRLVHFYATCEPQIPKGTQARPVDWAEEIASGLSASQIARKHGVHLRTVRRHFARLQGLTR